MSTVALLPHNGTTWSKMRPQYRLLEERSGWTPVVVLAAPNIYALKPQLEAEGVRMAELPPVARQDRGHFPGLERRWFGLTARVPVFARLDPLLQHDRVAHALPVALLRMARTRRQLRRDYAAFAALFRRLDPFVLLITGDRELGPVRPGLKAAKDLGIPSVITVSNVPSIPSHSAQRRGQARFLVRPSDLAPLINIDTARRLPGQVADTPDGRMLFSPGWLTQAFHREGMLGASPWCQGGGDSNFILLDGPRKERIYRELGVPQEKIRTLGDITQDPVYDGLMRRDALRRDLNRRYGLNPDRPLYLFAVPIYGEHDLMPWPEHLAALDRVMAVLRDDGANVLLSLHPRSSRETYAPMAARYGFPIADETLSEIIPASDVLLCGSSSTIEWAILCGIPAINIDYAGLNDPVWDQYPGVLRANDAEALRGLLQRLAAEPDWYRELSEAQRETARDFAWFDGRAGERFLDFLTTLHGEAADDPESALPERRAAAAQ